MVNTSTSDGSRQLTETIPDTIPNLGTTPSSSAGLETLAQYVLGEPLASGGMGAVHVGLKLGALGFQRVVAIKRLHAHLAHDIEFVARFKDEIRIVSRLTHPNVVQTFDVVESGGELALIMEFVDGLTLHEILLAARAAGGTVPPAIAVAILCQALHGLHAAHEARDDSGQPLGIVHRDVSPQNIMVARDGLVKVLDFGVAKASIETHVTRVGQLSGKPAYMAPEQVSSRSVDRRTDVFASGVVLWEALTGERLFRSPGTPESAALVNILEQRVPRPSELRPGLSAELDRIVLRALERDIGRRFASARDLALALEASGPLASASEIGDMLADLCSELLSRRAEAVRRFREDLANGAAQSAPAVNLTITAPASPAPLAMQRAADPYPVSSSDLAKTPLVVSADSELQTSDVQGVLVDGGPRSPFAPIRRTRTWLALAVAGVALWMSGRAVLGVQAGPSAVHQPDIAVAPPARALPAPTSARTIGATLSSQGPAPASSDATATTGPAKLVSTPTAEARRHGTVRDTRVQSEASRSKRGTPAAIRAAPAPSAPKRAARAADACSPPTYEDADGIRHFKRECL